MNLFDTHAHYDDSQFDVDRDSVLAGLPLAGVSLVLCPACNMQSARAVTALADRYPFVYAAVGIHPHDACHMGPEDVETLAQLSRHSKVMAIGEIGLDYHYDYSPRDAQLFCLTQQMELAEALNLPVIIHDREAHEDTLNVVKSFPGVRGVYHCYSGSLESAKTIVSLGYYISFTGVVTYKNARKALETAAWVPDDRLMIESDAPYLAPEPHRGRRNDSSLLRLTNETLAALRGVSAEELAALTTANGKRLFGIE